MPYKDPESKEALASVKRAQIRYREQHPDWCARNTRRWKDKMDSIARRHFRVKRNYHLSPERHEEMLRSQGYRCAFPNCLEIVDFRSAIDHDHKCCPQNARSCGKCVRGILCNKHNLGMGYFEQGNISCLIDAYIYLIRSSK